MSDEILKLKEEEKLAVWDDTEEEKESGVCQSWGGGDGWMAGAILIGIGLFFLLSRYLPFAFLGQWWALFLFVPGVVKVVNSLRGKGDDLTGGLILTFLGTMFLFNLSWSLMWPLVFVCVGIGLLLSRNRK